MITKRDFSVAAISTMILAGASVMQQGLADSSWLNEKKEILRHLTLVESAGVDGQKVVTIVLSRANFQIVNGLGATNGLVGNIGEVNPEITVTNGMGNLIIGYNEDLSSSSDPDIDRSGSHNIVGGIGAEYSSFGGAILGREGESSGAYASVLGGVNNEARGSYSTVLGGGGDDSGTLDANIASGVLSTISGGHSNKATGQNSSIAGGLSNRAAQFASVVLGGQSNFSDATAAVVCGGMKNKAFAPHSHVCGGDSNRANGTFSNVGGGFNRTADNQSDWAAGELFQDD